MARTVVVQLTDDLDGGEADETISFAIDGTSFEIDLNAKNADRLRGALRPFVEAARATGGRSRALGSKGRVATAAPTSRSRARASVATATLFSQLDSEERDRFRAWSNLPNARRIADSRVKEWIDLGKP
jgi:Lsr2